MKNVESQIKSSEESLTSGMDQEEERISGLLDKVEKLDHSVIENQLKKMNEWMNE